LPSFTSWDIALTVSSMGVLGSTLAALASKLTLEASFGSRTMPNLVASSILSRRPLRNWPSNSSLVDGPYISGLSADARFNRLCAYNSIQFNPLKI
jgi:hypothetical protein